MGSNNGEYRHKVGVIVSRSAAKFVMNYVPISERMLLLQINANPANINILQLYTPTTNHIDDEVIEFYSKMLR